MTIYLRICTVQFWTARSRDCHMFNLRCGYGCVQKQELQYCQTYIVHFKNEPTTSPKNIPWFKFTADQR